MVRKSPLYVLCGEKMKQDYIIPKVFTQIVNTCECTENYPHYKSPSRVLFTHLTQLQNDFEEKNSYLVLGGSDGC